MSSAYEHDNGGRVVLLCSNCKREASLVVAWPVDGSDDYHAHPHCPMCANRAIDEGAREYAISDYYATCGSEVADFADRSEHHFELFDIDGSTEWISADNSETYSYVNLEDMI